MASFSASIVLDQRRDNVINHGEPGTNKTALDKPRDNVVQLPPVGTILDPSRNRVINHGEPGTNKTALDKPRDNVIQLAGIGTILDPSRDSVINHGEPGTNKTALDKPRDNVIQLAGIGTILDPSRDSVINHGEPGTNKTALDKPRDNVIQLAGISTILDPSRDSVIKHGEPGTDKTALDKPRDNVIQLPPVGTVLDKPRSIKLTATIQTLQQKRLKMLPIGSITQWILNTKKTIQTTTNEPHLIARVSVATAGILLAKTTGTANTVMAIYDSNGDMLASHDDPLSNNSEISFGVTAGFYYIVARNVTTTAATFGFSLSIDIAGINTVIVDLDAPSSETLAQQNIDRLRLADLKNSIIANNSLENGDVVFYILGSSTLAESVMNTLDAGGGYGELIALGLSAARAISVLGVYNVRAETPRYESELGIDALIADKHLLTSFIAHADANGIVLPSFMPLFNAFRADRATYAAIRTWNNSRIV